MKQGLIKIKKQIEFFAKRIPKDVAIGIVGVALLYTGVAGIYSGVVPWANRSDTQYHIDYVWRVYHGELPRFEDGITYPPLKTETPIHLTASHPPLFYAIHAAFIGPLLDQGRWQEAIAVGRYINVFIGILCVLSLAWAGWVFGGRNRGLIAVATPAVGALFYRFTTLNGNFANDVLVVLWATIAIVLMYKIINRGVRWPLLVALGIISILGIATKATYVVILLVSLTSIPLSAYLHAPHNRLKHTLRAALPAMAIGILSVISIGWFYYLNYKASGSWFKSSPDEFSGGRVYHSLKDVLLGSKLWALFYTQSSTTPFLSTAFSAIAACGMLLLLPLKNTYKKFLSYIKQHASSIWIIAILIAIVVGVLATQIRHAVGYGSINFRYLLPALLPISLFFAYGLIQIKQARGQLVAFLSIAMAITTVLPAASSSTIMQQVPAVKSTSNEIERLFIAMTNNGIPFAVQIILILSLVAGVILLVRALYRLSTVHAGLKN